MRLTFLGTGTSFGVPVVGCGCSTCTSTDPRDARTRCGALLELPEGRVLVDAPPELRLQLLRERVDRVDAVWITHPHADHIHGVDDLRIFTVRRRETLAMHVPSDHLEEVRARFPYIFTSAAPPPGTSVPLLRLAPVRDGEPVEILGHSFHPFALPHGPMRTFGFRVGGLGFVPDAKRIPPAALAVLRGVEVLVLSALWWGDPHPTHMNLDEAVATAREVGARRTFLIHLTHRVRHRELLERLPDGIEPAHDGLCLEVSP
ncbi:MAG: MBL fold metallo-hydrolase [Longimicrobiales bacterium]|nr:MBL fold metallo-hydrolase [Longimicrobiales bacterium]